LIERALVTLLQVASQVKSNYSFRIIKRIYEQSSISVKLKATQVMYAFDRAHAKSCFDELEHVL
jgi:hypothetical protein